MEAVNIKEMEKKRFYAILIRCIASTLLLGSAFFISLDFSKVNSPLHQSLIFFNLLFIIVSWRTSTILEKIQKNQQLASALDGEIYLIYKYKVFMTGFFAAIGTALFLFCFNWLLELSVPSSCIAIVFVGSIATEIHRIILYKS